MSNNENYLSIGLKFYKGLLSLFGIGLWPKKPIHYNEFPFLISSESEIPQMSMGTVSNLCGGLHTLLRDKERKINLVTLWCLCKLDVSSSLFLSCFSTSWKRWCSTYSEELLAFPWRTFVFKRDSMEIYLNSISPEEMLEGCVD